MDKMFTLSLPKCILEKINKNAKVESYAFPWMKITRFISFIENPSFRHVISTLTTNLTRSNLRK